MSEEPIRFDLWVTVRKGTAMEALAAVMAAGLPRPEALRRVNRSSSKGEPLLLSGALGWDEVETFRASPPAWVANVVTQQEGIEPGQERARCEEHDLHYAGVLGCHVCRGYYATSEAALMDRRELRRLLLAAFGKEVQLTYVSGETVVVIPEGCTTTHLTCGFVVPRMDVMASVKLDEIARADALEPVDLDAVDPAELDPPRQPPAIG